MHLRSLYLLLALAAMPAFLRGGRRRRPLGHGRELQKYRDELGAATARIDGTLGAAAETIEALRHRSVDPRGALEQLVAIDPELSPGPEDAAPTAAEE